MDNNLLVLTWALLASTGLFLTLTWWKLSHGRHAAQPKGQKLNVWTTAVLTLGYSYFVIALTLSLTHWSQMLDHLGLFRNPEPFALFNVFLGIACVVISLLKRGIGGAQIVCSGALLSTLSLLLFFLLSMSQI
jgi:hypothetical protein